MANGTPEGIWLVCNQPQGKRRIEATVVGGGAGAGSLPREHYAAGVYRVTNWGPDSVEFDVDGVEENGHSATGVVQAGESIVFRVKQRLSLRVVTGKENGVAHGVCDPLRVY